MDFIGPLPVTIDGHNAIIVFVDKLSKMVHFAPCNTQEDAVQVAWHFVHNVFRLHGLPRRIISDRDSRFTGHFWRELCRLLRVQRAMGTAFHPQTDGQTERANRVLEEVLRHFVSSRQDDWHKYLPFAEFAINNAYNDTTRNTPFNLNYGQHPLTPATLPVDIRVPGALEFTVGISAAIERTRELLRSAQSRQKSYADRGRRDEVFQPGEEVPLRTKNLTIKGPADGKKLRPQWCGPFKVLDRVSDVAYRLELPKHYEIHDVFHVSLLKPYRTDGRVQPPPPVELDKEMYYEIDDIVAHRTAKRGNKRSYLVKWSGYGHEHNSWVNECDVTPSALRDYYARYPAAASTT